MNEPRDKDQKFISKLTEITLANLGDENFGVKELARESGMSRYTLTPEAICNYRKNRKPVYQGNASAKGFGDASI